MTTLNMHLFIYSGNISTLYGMSQTHIAKRGKMLWYIVKKCQLFLLLHNKLLSTFKRHLTLSLNETSVYQGYYSKLK